MKIKFAILSDNVPLIDYLLGLLPINSIILSCIIKFLAFTRESRLFRNKKFLFILLRNQSLLLTLFSIFRKPMVVEIIFARSNIVIERFYQVEAVLYRLIRLFINLRSKTFKNYIFELNLHYIFLNILGVFTLLRINFFLFIFCVVTNDIMLVLLL